MSNLAFTGSIAPSLTGVIVATALSSFSVTCHAGNNFNPSANEFIHKMEQIKDSSTPQTFSLLDVRSSNLNNNLDNMMVNLFEQLSANSKPLDADLAQLLSENFVDLF